MSDYQIPIHRISNRYLIFEIPVPLLTVSLREALAPFREKHHLLGTLIGTLPQIPQQNVFLSLPLELMPEEARLLVEAGAGYVVDSVTAHADRVKAMSEEEKDRVNKSWQRGFEIVQMERRRAKAESARDFWRRKKEKDEAAGKVVDDAEYEDKIPTPVPETVMQLDGIEPHQPHTALVSLGRPEKSVVPDVPSSYPVFKYLHQRGYYMSPGLRFGAKYMAYPGDPLRFHSHFLVGSKGWDEEFDIMEIVGGGRLGGGVKKGWMVGGVEREDEQGEHARVFCVEWGGF